MSLLNEFQFVIGIVFLGWLFLFIYDFINILIYSKFWIINFIIELIYFISYTSLVYYFMLEFFFGRLIIMVVLLFISGMLFYGLFFHKYIKNYLTYKKLIKKDKKTCK